jgi:hypothetical protein
MIFYSTLLDSVRPKQKTFCSQMVGVMQNPAQLWLQIMERVLGPQIKLCDVHNPIGHEPIAQGIAAMIHNAKKVLSSSTTMAQHASCVAHPALPSVAVNNIRTLDMRCKTVPCKDFLWHDGRCRNGSRCVYKHGEDDTVGPSSIGHILLNLQRYDPK